MSTVSELRKPIHLMPPELTSQISSVVACAFRRGFGLPILISFEFAVNATNIASTIPFHVKFFVNFYSNVVYCQLSSVSSCGFNQRARQPPRQKGISQTTRFASNSLQCSLHPVNGRNAKLTSRQQLLLNLQTR